MIIPHQQRRDLAVDRAWKLVGRQTELSELLCVLDRFAAGESGTRLVELAGEAGIGKTALLHEFAKVARGRGAVVLASWGGSGLDETPFAAFADAFDRHERPLTTALADGTRRQCCELAAFFPMVDCGHEALDEARAKFPYPLHRAVRELLEELASPMLVLIMDDLHTADTRSLDLLANLLRQPPKARVLFVLGYRDHQADAMLRSVIDGWSPQVAAIRIHLGPLSEREVGEILAGQGIPSWRRQLYEDSWGNPAYLRALISERLRFPGGTGSPGLDQGVRSGHYATFLGDLAGVTPMTREVADAAAVIGCDFDAELVAQMLEQPEFVVLSAIDELISRDLVRSAARGHHFAFRHPVVHRAVYFGSELSRRVQLHIRADDVLRARGVSVTVRAPHVEQWARHGDLEAVDVLDEAARACTGTRPATAASWLTTALRVLPHQQRFEQRRAGLLVRLAKARGSAGDLRECRDIMHEALCILPMQPSAEHAKAVAFTAMVQRLLGTYTETDAMLRAEIDALGGGDLAGCAALKFEIASRELSRGDWTACCRLAHEALALAQQSQVRYQELAWHGLLAKANASGGNLDVAAAHLGHATAILDGMLDRDFTHSLDAVLWIGWSDALLEHWDDALRHFGKAVEFASRSGRLLALPHMLTGHLLALFNNGRLAEAQDAAEYAVYLAQQSGSPEQLMSAYSMLAWMDTVMGRLDRALESGVAADRHLRGGVGGFGALALRMLGEARLLTGDHEGCLALISLVGGPSLLNADTCSRIAWYELLTRAELALGRPKEAARWADSAAAAAALLDQPGRNALSLLARAQVLLAVDPGSALSPAEQAAAGLAATGMKVDALRARVVLGTALWHRGRADDAVRELKGAQLAFEQIGATTLAKLARTERRRLAARTSRARCTDSEGTVTVLTDRERQIADLVGEGLTNRLIAKRLHISEKTVEMHLSKVFAKLGVANRAAAAAFVTRDRPVANSA